MAFEKAKRGADIALAALAAGIADAKLRDKGADCIKEAVIAILECLRSNLSVPNSSEWLDKVSNSMTRFGQTPYWKSLVSAVNALAATPRCPAGAKRLAEAVRAIDEQVWSGSSASSRPLTKEVLIGEIVSLRDTFGFIRHPAFPKNLFFHAGSVLDGNGLESLNTGCLVNFVVAETNRGETAVNIARIS